MLPIPGMMTSPGRCPGWQGPSHLPSTVCREDFMPRSGGEKVMVISLR